MEDDVRRFAPNYFSCPPSIGQLGEIPRYLRGVPVRAIVPPPTPRGVPTKHARWLQLVNWKTRIPAENCQAFRWLLKAFRV